MKKKRVASPKRAAKPAQRDSLNLEIQRIRLSEALGIIEVSRHALASKLTTLDEDSVIDALKAAYRIVDEVAGAIETPHAEHFTS